MDGATIILGANPISEKLIATLNRYGYDIILIDENAHHLKKISLEYDINTICAHPSFPASLQEANIEQANHLIATTSIDEQNLTACLLHHSLYPKLNYITTLNHSHYQHAMTHLPGASISPLSNNQSIFEDIKYLIHYPLYSHIHSLSSRLVAATIQVEDEFSYMGKTLDEMKTDLPKGIILSGLRRNDQWCKYRGNIKISLNDELLVILPPDHLDYFHPQEFIHQKKPIILLGISSLTFHLCKMLSENHPITVIDASASSCQDLSRQYGNITVLNEDPQSPKTLINCNAKNALVFACSNDDEDNLICSFQAHECQASHVYTLISNVRHGHIFDQSPIHYTINAPQVISDEIIRNLLQKNGIGHFYTKNNYLQMAEIFIAKNHPFQGKTLKEIQLPDGIYAGCIIRDQSPLFTSHNTPTLIGDSVILYGPHDRDQENPLERMLLPPGANR